MTSPAPAWVLPGEPTPVRLMNTIWADANGVYDDLSTPAGLGEWLAVVTEQSPETLKDLGPRLLAEAILLRDALRRLAAFCTHDDRSTATLAIEDLGQAIAAVNDAVTQRPRTQLILRGDRLRRERPTRASPTRVALAELAHEAVDLLTGPTATKLRACHAPGCVLYFVKTHPRREWCSEACGNRARAARHYQKIRTSKR